jgi:antitoxin CptB
MSDPTDPDLPPRRRRLRFRAAHRGTREADLMVGAFVGRHIATFTEAEIEELERLLDLPDVDLADWLTGRGALPAGLASPLTARMLAECSAPGAGLPPELRRA